MNNFVLCLCSRHYEMCMVHSMSRSMERIYTAYKQCTDCRKLYTISSCTFDSPKRNSFFRWLVISYLCQLLPPYNLPPLTSLPLPPLLTPLSSLSVFVSTSSHTPHGLCCPSCLVSYPCSTDFSLISLISGALLALTEKQRIESKTISNTKD